VNPKRFSATVQHGLASTSLPLQLS